MAGSPVSSPSLAPSSRASRASSRASLTLDLSNLPPLVQPSPPTNTLLITNLNDTAIFRPENLQTIRDLVSATAPVNSWSPLKSFRRIVVSFADEQAAIKVRSVWDGEAIMGERCRVYFGKHTPLQIVDNHLTLPDAGKLFFISPPPSPPHGWEMRMEDAPNTKVHAEDLAEALAKLNHRPAEPVADHMPISPIEGVSATTRSRSSTLIFQPDATSPAANLPCIAVDDMTDSPTDVDFGPLGNEKPIMAHTSRPPVELMME